MRIGAASVTFGEWLAVAGPTLGAIGWAIRKLSTLATTVERYQVEHDALVRDLRERQAAIATDTSRIRQDTSEIRREVKNGAQ